MISECEYLTRLLRCELTAVNQQFIHVLALRDWGYAETAERIRRALARLRPDDREVLRLAREEGFTLLEVAKRMGRTHAAARKLYSRALARLAELYDEDARG